MYMYIALKIPAILFLLALCRSTHSNTDQAQRAPQPPHLPIIGRFSPDGFKGSLAAAERGRPWRCSSSRVGRCRVGRGAVAERASCGAGQPPAAALQPTERGAAVLAAAAAERSAAERGARPSSRRARSCACSIPGRARRCSSRAKSCGAGSSRRRARSSCARRGAV